jgi:hypothetical protein
MSFINSLRVRGIDGTLQLAWRHLYNPRKLPGYVLSRMVDLERYDREHNVETAGLIELDELEFQSESKSDGSRYGGASPLVFFEAMERLAIDHSKYTFIDIGSGKGSALFYASDFPFREIIGVEFAPELDAVAQKNIKTFRSNTQKCRNIQAVCGDAAVYDYPPGPWVLFFNCPFGPPVWSKVAANLEQARHGFRDSYLVHMQAGFRPGAKEFVRGLPFLNLTHADDMVEIFRFVA